MKASCVRCSLVSACSSLSSSPGKTAAFLLPFIAHLVINGRPAPMGGSGRNRRYMPVGLILAPTRELATQIWEESLKFTCQHAHARTHKRWTRCKWECVCAHVLTLFASL